MRVATYTHTRVITISTGDEVFIPYGNLEEHEKDRYIKEFTHIYKYLWEYVDYMDKS